MKQSRYAVILIIPVLLVLFGFMISELYTPQKGDHTSSTLSAAQIDQCQDQVGSTHLGSFTIVSNSEAHEINLAAITELESGDSRRGDDEYNAVITPNFVFATFPGPNQELDKFLFQGCVCADVGAIEEPYDNLSVDTVAQRLQLYLDGRIVDSIVQTYAESDRQLKIRNLDWPEDATATVPESVTVCWYDPSLDIGAHTAKIIFSTTSGQKHEYNWEFDISEFKLP